MNPLTTTASLLWLFLEVATPVKSLHFYRRRYLAVAERIALQRERRAATTTTAHLGGNSRRGNNDVDGREIGDHFHPLHLLIAMIGYNIGHQTLLVLWLPQQHPSPAAIITHADNVSVAFGGLRPVRLCLIVLHTLAVYFYRRFYFGADLRLVYLLEAVLFGPAYSAPLCHPLYRGRSAARMIRVVGAGILNSLQVFTVAADAIVAGLAVMFGLLATAECGLSPPSVAPLFLFHLTTLIIDIYAFTHVLILAAATGSTLLYVLFMRTWQNLASLRRSLRRRRRKEVGFGVNRFIHHDIRTVELIELANRNFASLLLSFLVVNVPVSAYFTISLVVANTGAGGDGGGGGGGGGGYFHSTSRQGRQTPLGSALMASLLAMQMVCILGFHLAAAHFTQVLYRSPRLLFHLAAERSKLHHCHHHHHVITLDDLRLRLRLWLTIERLHTRRPLGITYGPYGLVRMASFVKCLGIYSEFLMYAYMFTMVNV